MFGHTVLLACCVGVAACGSSEPRSPLILGDKSAQALPGPRDLTSEQSRSLQGVIASAGEPCGGITLAYLSGTDPADGSEAWEVRCPDAAYAVLIRSDGTPNAVRRCGSGVDSLDRPCASRARRPVYQGRQPQGGELNPELKKLLEPMTSKAPKSD